MDKKKFFEIVSPYSITSKERINALYDALEEIINNNLEGDIVECGVYKGGNILGIIEYLNFHKVYNKKVWLYDTFEGMTESSEIDQDFQGNDAKKIFEQILCSCSLDEVSKLLSNSEFPSDNLKFIKGDVRQTLKINLNVPEKISLLRLDTDFYDSTKKELEILYPKLNNHGILMVDDYGHWKGCKTAVDEYFPHKIEKKFIDYTCIVIRKSI